MSTKIEGPCITYLIEFSINPRRSRTRSLTIENALIRAARSGASGDRSGGAATAAAPAAPAARPQQQQVRMNSMAPTDCISKFLLKPYWNPCKRYYKTI